VLETASIPRGIRTSVAAVKGFNLRTIQQLLGHQDLRMTMRYSQRSAEHLQQAVNRLDTVMGASAERSESQQRL
jgi:integrase